MALFVRAAMTDFNKRCHPRRAVRIDATMLLPDDNRQLDVLVVNLSAGGASVETDAALTAGTRIVLSAREFGRFEGETRWQRGRRLGIRFVDATAKPGQNDNPPHSLFERSPESHAFEEMWRSLPRQGSIPDRGAFKPRLAKLFLRDIILAQAPSPGEPALRIRIVGDAIRQHIQDDIVGEDYFDFMEEEERKAAARDLVREMFERPCGQWWVAPVHYERGYSQFWEVTSFPLAASHPDPAAVLGLVRPFDSLPSSPRNPGGAIRIDGAVKFQTIPIQK